MSGFAMGAQTNTVYTATELTQGKAFAVGDRYADSIGQEWLFVRSGSAITAYDCVHVNASYDANPITDTLALTAGFVGFAQVAYTASNQYGWVMVSGQPTIRLAASCADDVPLYTTNTAGVLDDATASASGSQIMSVIANGSASGGGVTAVACTSIMPTVRRPAA